MNSQKQTKHNDNKIKSPTPHTLCWIFKIQIQRINFTLQTKFNPKLEHFWRVNPICYHGNSNFRMVSTTQKSDSACMFTLRPKFHLNWSILKFWRKKNGRNGNMQHMISFLFCSAKLYMYYVPNLPAT